MGRIFKQHQMLRFWWLQNLSAADVRWILSSSRSVPLWNVIYASKPCCCFLSTAFGHHTVVTAHFTHSAKDSAKPSARGINHSASATSNTETYLGESFCSDSYVLSLEYHIPLDQQSSLGFPVKTKQNKKPQDTVGSVMRFARGIKTSSLLHPACEGGKVMKSTETYGTVLPGTCHQNMTDVSFYCHWLFLKFLIWKCS